MNLLKFALLFIALSGSELFSAALNVEDLELDVSDSDEQDFESKQKEDKNGDDPCWGVAVNTGSKRQAECEFYSVNGELTKGRAKAFFGLYAGNNIIAHYLSNNLYKNICASLCPITSQCITEGFARTNMGLKDVIKNSIDSKLAGCKASALVAFFTDNKVNFALAGDSTVIVATEEDGKLKASKVFESEEELRHNGFGNDVICEPYLDSMDIDPEHKFLVMASDNVCSVFNNDFQKVVDKVAEELIRSNGNYKSVAEYLKNYVVEQIGDDKNITIILIDIQRLNDGIIERNKCDSRRTGSGRDMYDALIKGSNEARSRGKQADLGLSVGPEQVKEVFEKDAKKQIEELLQNIKHDPEMSTYASCFGIVQKARIGKKYSEDRTAAKIGNDYAYFGVFDGFGGSEVANFAATDLSENILEVAVKEKYQDVIIEGINSCFFRTHVETPKDYEGGTCALVALIKNQRIYIGNAGDSRAIVASKGQPILISHDHNLKNEKERERVGFHNAIIKRSNDDIGSDRPLRVWAQDGSGVGIVPTRALGNKDVFGPFVIIPEPQTHSRDISENEDAFLILASDGLWDKVTNEEAVTIVNEVLKKTGDCQQAAEALSDLALKHGSIDDISIIVVNIPELLKTFTYQEEYPSSSSYERDGSAEEAESLADLIGENGSLARSVEADVRAIADQDDRQVLEQSSSWKPLMYLATIGGIYVGYQYRDQLAKWFSSLKK